MRGGTTWVPHQGQVELCTIWGTQCVSRLERRSWPVLFFVIRRSASADFQGRIYLVGAVSKVVDVEGLPWK